MRIISVRRGFASDHSSTSYEFLAVDRQLTKAERAEVSKLSSRANVTARRADFVYNVDGYDIPGGWDSLMARYYDVMYSESYDWWTLAMAFNAEPGKYEELCQYEFSGVDDLGVYISKDEHRVIVTISCRIDMRMAHGYNDYYNDEDDGDECEESDAGAGGMVVVTDDDLLDLLVKIRKQIIDGDYRTLYAVWEMYGASEDEDDENEDEEDKPPPKPEDTKAGKETINEFKRYLDSY